MGKKRDERHDGTDSRRPPWYSRLVPGTPLGYALAALSVLIVGLGVYAVSAKVRDLTGVGPAHPSAADTSETIDSVQIYGGPSAARDLFRSHVPAGGGEELRQTKTASNVRVALEWAYADANSVVVGYTVEDRGGGRSLGGHPAELQPSGSDGLRLTDESGTGFGLVEGGGEVSPGPNSLLKGAQANVAVFEAEGRVETGNEHRFRLEIPVSEVQVAGPEKREEGVDSRRIGEPFFFGFETSVQPATVVEVDRKATAGGITLALERVTDSPGQPEAVVCLESREGVHGWVPTGTDLAIEAPSPVSGEGDCLQVPLSRPLDGSSSVTVDQIEINPFCPSCTEGPEVVGGPWRFDFEVPGR